MTATLRLLAAIGVGCAAVYVIAHLVALMAFIHSQDFVEHTRFWKDHP